MIFMSKSKPSILIISSANPTTGAGVVAEDYYKALSLHGFEVDLLTHYKCNSHPEFLYVKDLNKKSERIKLKIKRHIDKIYRYIRAKIHKCLAYPHAGYYFFYYEEEKPPISVDDVLSQINKPYDIVYILFWQGMLSFATVRAIYNKLHCVVFFGGVDYSQMSGGCHFTGDCENYKTGCGCCPAFESNDIYDFTKHNVAYRKKVYDEVKPIVFGNSYMMQFYRQSFLLKNYQYYKSQAIIDTNLFRPLDKSLLYEQYGISKEKKFKILFGCQSVADERKGIKYLIEAINIFVSKLTEKELSHVLVMVIGNDFVKVKSQLCNIDTYDFGFVSKTDLAKLFAFSDVFLCSSVNDAGPMMVNQSLCCGTPVVGFEMGTCLDAVKDQGTGYCARLRDSKDFAHGIDEIFRLSDNERLQMSAKCIEFANTNYSYAAAVKRLMNAYENRIG